MSKYTYVREDIKYHPVEKSVIVHNPMTSHFQVILPDVGSLRLTTWLGGCGLAFMESFNDVCYINDSKVAPENIMPVISLVEDIMKDMTINHNKLRLNSQWPVKDVYFTLAFTSTNFKIGDTFGEFTKLINIHVNKAHGPRSIFTFIHHILKGIYMPTKYLHTRVNPSSNPRNKKGQWSVYETTVKIVYGEEGLSSNEVEVSVSVCSPNDMFCRELGRADADTKTPVILAKHKVFSYMDDMEERWNKTNRDRLLILPDSRRLALALLKV